MLQKLIWNSFSIKLHLIFSFLHVYIFSHFSFIICKLALKMCVCVCCLNILGLPVSLQIRCVMTSKHFQFYLVEYNLSKPKECIYHSTLTSTSVIIKIVCVSMSVCVFVWATFSLLFPMRVPASPGCLPHQSLGFSLLFPHLLQHRVCC